jgi:hypothetical protein
MTHAPRRAHHRSPPPVTDQGPIIPTSIWGQLPIDRRERLQKLLAELLARQVTLNCGGRREVCHE